MVETDASVTDGSLVERARRGDTAAYEALVRRHYRAAYAVAIALVGNGMDAEDVCQDGFVKALERLDDCRKPDRFRAWLLQIVRNRAHNFRSYQQLRDGVPLDTTLMAAPHDTARVAERQELRETLEEALRQLSEVQRQVVLLHDLEGMKHREIAAALELSESMSRQHLMNARRLLRAHLGRNALEEFSHE